MHEPKRMPPNQYRVVEVVRTHRRPEQKENGPMILVDDELDAWADTQRAVLGLMPSHDASLRITSELRFDYDPEKPVGDHMVGRIVGRNPRGGELPIEVQVISWHRLKDTEKSDVDYLAVVMFVTELWQMRVTSLCDSEATQARAA